MLVLYISSYAVYIIEFFLPAGVKAAARFSKHLRTSANRLNHAIKAYNDLVVPCGTFPNALLKKDVLEADEAWWLEHLKFLNHTNPTKRLLIDAFHRKWRGEEEILLGQDDFANLLTFLQESQDECKRVIASLLAVAPQSCATLGKIHLVQCQLIGLANFIRSSETLSPVLETVSLDIASLHSLADGVDPALEIIFKLALEENDEVLFAEDVELIEDIIEDCDQE